MTRKTALMMLGVVAAAGSLACADVSNYDALAEDFYGETFTHNGVTYRDVNIFAGVFPNGETFDADGLNGLGHTIIVEDSTFFYNDFPEWGSPTNTLTFGTAYVNGPNLSLGALSTVTMDLATPATSASMDTAYYENGPWGGQVVHLDALLNGVVVASDTFTVSDLGGRDNIALRSMSVTSAGSFDQLKLYSTFGASPSGLRMIIDDLTLTTTPSCAADLDDGSGNGTPDGGVDINDLLYFLGAFETGTEAADLDNGSGTGTPDGGVDINDLLYFLLRFEAGC
jgi:hypothetical protein